MTTRGIRDKGNKVLKLRLPPSFMPLPVRPLLPIPVAAVSTKLIISYQTGVLQLTCMHNFCASVPFVIFIF